MFITFVLSGSWSARRRRREATNDMAYAETGPARVRRDSYSRAFGSYWRFAGLAGSCLIHIVVLAWPMWAELPQMLEPVEALTVEIGAPERSAPHSLPSDTASMPLTTVRRRPRSATRVPMNGAVARLPVRTSAEDESRDEETGHTSTLAHSMAGNITPEALPPGASPSVPAAHPTPPLMRWEGGEATTPIAGSAIPDRPDDAAGDGSGHPGPIAAVSSVPALPAPRAGDLSPRGDTAQLAAAALEEGRAEASERTGQTDPTDRDTHAPAGPRFLVRAAPSYPVLARRLAQEATVLLRLTIDERGHLTHIEVVQSADYGFTDAAVDAAQRSVFAPAERGGRPVRCRALLPVRFILRRAE